MVYHQTTIFCCSILKETPKGINVYTEEHSAQTSITGIINLEVGKGLVKSGVFSTIFWGSDSYFIKVEMALNGSSIFEFVGVSQLLSVPYSLYAEKSGDEKWGNTNNDIFYNSGKVGLGTSTPQVKLDIDGAQDLNLLQLRNNNNSLGIIASVSSDTDFHGSALIGKRSRGSFLTPTTVFAGDRITGLYGSLFAGNAYQNAGAIQLYLEDKPQSI